MAILLLKVFKFIIKFQLIVIFVMGHYSWAQTHSSESSSNKLNLNFENQELKKSLRQKLLHFKCTESVIQCQAQVFSLFSQRELAELNSEFRKIRSNQPKEIQMEIDNIFNQIDSNQSISEIHEQLIYKLESSASLMGVVQGLAVIGVIVFLVKRSEWVKCESDIHDEFVETRKQIRSSIANSSGSNFAPISTIGMTLTEVSEAFALERNAKNCECHGDIKSCNSLKSNKQNSEMSTNDESFSIIQGFKNE